jgi:hypothetical protein
MQIYITLNANKNTLALGPGGSADVTLMVGWRAIAAGGQQRHQWGERQNQPVPPAIHRGAHV